MSTRREKDNVMMGLAESLSMLSTCRRRSVGCVIVDWRYRIIGTGYNGVPSRFDHCNDKPCPLHDAPHGSPCYASHAEANALVQCQNVDNIHAIFTTSFPCIDCAKLIMNTSCQHVYYVSPYPAHEDHVCNLFNGKIELTRL